MGHLCLMLASVSTPAYLIVSKQLLQLGHAPLTLATATFAGSALLFSAALGGLRWLSRVAPELHDVSGRCLRLLERLVLRLHLRQVLSRRHHLRRLVLAV